MNEFMQRHAHMVVGRLDGFDRMRFRGTLRFVANPAGLACFLRRAGVLLKDFRQYALDVTERIKSASLAVATACGRPVRYLASAAQSKENIARAIAAEEGIREGLICVLHCVEPCRTFHMRKGEDGRLHPRLEFGKCTHVYHYHLDPVFGLMHVRLQTWFPFTIMVCINGRERLAKQMDAAGIGYLRRENCFVHVEDVAAAQRLLDEQLRTRWPSVFNRMACAVSPAHRKVFASEPLHYYWSAEETEWASDVMFGSADDLAGLYPHLTRHAMVHLSSDDVLRFLGRKTATEQGGRPRGKGFQGEALSSYRRRTEGVRVRHSVNRNSIKMYDKQGSVLRIETTINNTREFKVFRRPENRPKAPRSWQRLRKGVADLKRRADVSQSANERYFKALDAAEAPLPLERLVSPLCRPAQDAKGRRVRALNPFAGEDARLLDAVSRGEFLINGLRNRDLRRILCEAPAADAEARRQSARISRQLRMLVAHGILRKIPGTHRYQVTAAGRRAITALRAAQAANTEKLLKAA